MDDFIGWGIFFVTLLAMILSAGCIAPYVESRKEIFLISNPACASNCSAGKVTVNMNSGTDVKAETDQDVSPTTEVKLK